MARTRILKTRRHDEEAQIEFELAYLPSLTTRQRFDLMFQKSREMAAAMRRGQARGKTEIIKRT